MEKSANSTEKSRVDEFPCAFPLKKGTDNLKCSSKTIIMLGKMAH